MSDVSFDIEEILEESRKAAGLDDFGTDDFRPGLEMLAATYDTGGFNARGRKRNRRRLVDLLGTRLRIEDAFKKHPEILERPVKKPMVLTGMPRSGTSALFNLLACDPDARPLLLWEAMFPDPLEGLEPGQSDPRRDAIEAHFAKSREENPEFTKMHYAGADVPEECVLIHAFAFTGVQMGVEIMAEPYGTWYREQNLGGLYTHYRKLLQLLDWQRPGERWLLKAPAHMWGIDPLIEHFPDVSIVWSHRNPLMCTASICSMTWTMMNPVTDISKEALGPIVMDFYATSLERGLASRDAHDAARFVDVTHDDFVGDSLGVAKRIYGHFEMPMANAATSAFEEHVAANPKGKHGSHEYSLEEYGLDPIEVRERFAPYIERFQISAD
jgi:hypothetical protein